MTGRKRRAARRVADSDEEEEDVLANVSTVSTRSTRSSARRPTRTPVYQESSSEEEDDDDDEEEEDDGDEDDEEAGEDSEDELSVLEETPKPKRVARRVIKEESVDPVREEPEDEEVEEGEEMEDDEDEDLEQAQPEDEEVHDIDTDDEVATQLEGTMLQDSTPVRRTPRQSLPPTATPATVLAVKQESLPPNTMEMDPTSPVKPSLKDDPASPSLAPSQASNQATIASSQSPVKPIKAMDTVLERPMDIMLKSRSQPQVVQEDEPVKPRLVITYLILTNFKSYAGRQEVGPFHASFSSVVGPNGSGKSNVIDSLLFVFGFRASKMRQGKISALIHNSAQHPDLDHCEVSVHFHEVLDRPGGGGSDVVPDSELVISRRAFKNNSSKYYINNRESNFTSVTGLLRERGVDLDHKRFLILQGEVESIAQMKAKAGNEHEDGLLEYLEDIIGTSQYKTPIEEAATEVETLNDVCMEKSGRVQHVEKEKNSLENKKNTALAYVHDENELSLKRAALFQINIADCSDNISASEEAIQHISTELQAELDKHEGSEKLIKDLTRAHAKGNKEFEAYNEEVQALKKEMSRFEQERVKFDEKRKFLEDKCKKLQKTIRHAEETAGNARDTINECQRDIEARSATVSELEAQVQAEEAELERIKDGLKGKTQAYSDQIAALQKQLEPWTAKINQKQSAIAVAESELNMLREKANAGAVAFGELQAKATSIKQNGREKEQALAELEAQKLELEKELAEMEEEIRGLADQEPKVRSKVSNARQKAEEARSSLSASQNQGNVLNALMRLQESGRIDGFHGRLGNLGTIDQKYDVAISTACSQLDNFVTDNVECGQQCIEYLRKTNLGRGNFMCLDKLRVRDMRPINTPENAPRLFDLVKFKDDRFRPAFYHALKDTLVADDLAQANRLAYGQKRYRVVTLQGALIDLSGTMTGGGQTVKKGLMSSKLVASVSAEAVAKLEEDRDALEARFQEYQDYMRDRNDRIRQLKVDIPQLDVRMQKMRLEIESMSNTLQDTMRRMKELKAEHQPSDVDNNRIAALESEIAKLNGEIERLHGETANIDAEIKGLQDKIMEVGGEKLRAKRNLVSSLKEEISENQEEISSAEVRMVKAEKQIKKLEREHGKATSELEVAGRDMERLNNEVANQDQIAEELHQRVETASEALALKKKELAALKAELDKKTAELNETRAIEIEMRNKLEQNQKVLVENQRSLKYWEDKMSKLSLQNIEDLMGSETIVIRKEKGGKKKKAKKAKVVRDEYDEDVEMGDAHEEEEDEEDDDEEEEEGDEDEDAEMEEIPLSKQPQELPRYSRDELSDMSKDQLKREIAVLEEKTSNVSVDLSVLSEYRRRVEEHAARSSDLTSAVNQRDAAKKRCDDLRRMRLEGFMTGFGIISQRLKEMYQMITMGGNAELELVDSLDPFSEGILFSVMPPKKSWKNISNLSGGEKTLSSLALVFALHHYKPTPLYVMDEIDAALDFRNVSIVANYIKERTKNAQFIVISLRNNMFELAARLVGVYKVNHMTKSVTIENKDFIQRKRPQQSQQLGGGTQTQSQLMLGR